MTRSSSVAQRAKRRSSCTKEFVLAFDGSPDGREALAQAKTVASACGAAVHLVAIIDPSESMLVVEAMSLIPDNQRFVVQAVLDEAVRRLRGAGCTATSELKYGKPAEQIILSAAEIDADLIVVGHRDQGALARWLNGSVGEINLASTAMQRARGRKVPAARERRHADAMTEGARGKMSLGFPSSVDAFVGTGLGCPGRFLKDIVLQGVRTEKRS